MENDIQFATTVEQSKELMELGIPVDTADMHYADTSDAKLKLDFGFSKVLMEEYPKETNLRYVPAWSVTALIKLMPTYIEENEPYHRRIVYDFSLETFGPTIFSTKVEEYVFQYKSCDGEILNDTDYTSGKNIMTAAFNMVVWLINEKLLCL